MEGRIRAGYGLGERNRGENATNNGEYMQPTMGRNATNNAQIRIICRIFDIFCRNNLHKCEKSSIFAAAFEK
jgi:hypothetical protein